MTVQFPAPFLFMPLQLCIILYSLTSGKLLGTLKIVCMNKTLLKKMIVSMVCMVAMCAGLVACSSDDSGSTPNPAKPAIEKFSYRQMQFTNLGGSDSFTFTTNTNWSLTVSSENGNDWCVVNSTSGKAGGHSINVNVTENLGYDYRRASITLHAGSESASFEVVQGQTDAIILSEKEIVVKPAGAVIEVKLSANIDYDVSMPNIEWLTPISTTRTLQEKILSYRVEKNETDDDRVARIYFANTNKGIEETLIIRQECVILPAVELHVEAGKFAEIFKSRPGNCQNLILIGEMNADDISFLSTIQYKYHEGYYLDLSQVKIVSGGRYQVCSEITGGPYEAYLPGYENELGCDAFGGSDVRTIKLPQSLTHIDQHAFHDSRVRSITFPDNLSSVSWGAFKGCSRLKNAIIPEGQTRIYSETFYYCGLKEIKIPNSITVIEEKAFYNCSSLVDIEIPSSVEEIEDKAFHGCRSLNRITFSNGLKKIGTEAFRYCKFQEVIIPNSVEDLSEAFDYVNVVKVYAQTPPKGFIECDKLYVPKGTYHDYYLARWGGKAKEIIEMEE